MTSRLSSTSAIATLAIWAPQVAAIAMPAWLFTARTGSSAFVVIPLGVSGGAFALGYLLHMRVRWLWGVLGLVALTYVTIGLVAAGDRPGDGPRAAAVALLAVLFAILVAASWSVGVGLGRAARSGIRPRRTLGAPASRP